MIVTYMPTSMIAYAVDNPDQTEVEATAPEAEETSDDAVSEDTVVEDVASEEVTSPEEQSSEEADKPADEPKEDVKTEAAGKDTKAGVGLLKNGTTLTAEGDDYSVSAEIGKNAKVPADTELQTFEIKEGDDGYDEYYQEALKALENEFGEAKKIKAIKFYDISLEAESQEGSVEPKSDVNVKIEYDKGIKMEDADSVHIVHFGDKEAEVLDKSDNNVETNVEKSKMTETSFATDGFSVFAVIVIENEEGTLEVDQDGYKITINYSKEANIPVGTELVVEEIDPDSEAYAEYWEKAIQKINEGVKQTNAEGPAPLKGLSEMEFFDISLHYNGKEIEPDTPLDVHIDYDEGGLLIREGESPIVVHFTDKETELIKEVDTEEISTDEVSEHLPDGTFASSYEYELDSFSVIGIGATGEYVDINEGNILKAPISIKAVGGTRASSEIAASKTVTDTDGDGVYEMALSVTGASESSSSTSVDKANVVLLVDVSGSMDFNVYTPYTYSEDTYDDDVTYYRGNSGNPGTCFYWPGGNYYGQYHAAGWYYGNRWNSYSGTVYTRETRLDATKRALNELVDALLANNKPAGTVAEDGVTKLDDIIEITLVQFSWATRTETLIRNAKTAGSATTNDTLKYYIDRLDGDGGTNWERGLQVAKAEADAYKTSQPNESTSIIFITDGVPTSWGASGTNGGPETASNTHKGWTEASDEARSITTGTDGKPNHTLYNIFAFGTDTTKYPDDNDGNRTDADYLRALTNYAYAGNNGGHANGYEYTDSNTQYVRDYFFNAKDTKALQDAFKKIIENLSNTVGYGGVNYEDGVTVGVTNTSATVDGTVHEGSFRYTVRNGKNIIYTVKIENGTATFKVGSNTVTDDSPETVTTVVDPDDSSKDIKSIVYSVEVDGKTYAMSPAVINKDTGLVDWDLAGLGILENGYTYTVAFDVWPNQEAYDTVADLNNGIIGVEEVDPKIMESLRGPDANGQYSIVTNWKQEVNYYSVDTVTDDQGHETTTYTPQPTKEIPFPDQVALTSKPLPMVKIWDSNLSPDQIGNLLYKDYPTNSEPTEYRVKLHLWKADTPQALQNQIAQYAGDPATASENDYIEKTLGWNGTDYDWDDTVAIAPGTMVSLQTAVDMGIDTTSAANRKNIVTYDGQQYYIIEKGHYYYVTEDNIDWHFELQTEIYHPMMVNGRLKNVTFITDAQGNITGVEDVEDLTRVTATNSKTAELDITKKVVDNTGKLTDAQKDAETFTYKVTLTVPVDADMSHTNAFEWVPRPNDTVPGTAERPRYYVYGYQTSEDASLLGFDDDVSRFNQKVFGRYTVSYDYDADDKEHVLNNIFTVDADGKTKTGTIFVTLKQNEIIRFTNLPSETQYRIEEMYNNLYQADPSRDADANLGENAPASNVEAQGYSVSIATKNGDPTVSGRVVEGTIDELNKRYYNQFTNTLDHAVDVELKGTKHLDGYEWSNERYYFNLSSDKADAPMPSINGRTRFYVSEPSGTADKSYSFGRIRFTEAGTYTYKIKEDNAGTLQVVNGKAVQFGGEETVTIVVSESDGQLVVDSVTGNNTTWDASTRTANTTITNEAPTISVSAEKEWENADETTDAPANAKVTFKLYADGVETDKTVELDGTVDNNGEATAWKATFSNLQKYKVENGQAVEIVYTVGETEVYPNGYTATPATPVSDGGTIKNTQDTTTVTAEKTWGAAGNYLNAARIVVDLVKEVVRTVDGEEVKERSTVESDVEITPDGQGNWSYTFRNLPEVTEDGIAIVYKVVETAVYDEEGNDISDAYKDAEGNLPEVTANAQGTAAIVNEPEGLDLIVKKTFSGNDGNLPENFKITVNYKDTENESQSEDLTLAEGEVQTDGSYQWTISGVSYGTTATASETNTAITDYTLDREASEVTDDTTIARSNNVLELSNVYTRDKGNLEVSKTVESELAADADAEFEFTVTLGDTSINGVYGDMTFEDGVATFTLKGGESVTATNLPTSITYTVAEAEADGFTTEPEEAVTGTITKDATPEVAFTNTRNVGDLEVTKTVDSDLAADADEEFEFTVTLGDTSISGTYGDMEFEDGVATFTLKGGESATAEGLPTDVTYTVVETANDDFVTTKTGDRGTISTDKSTAAFTNKRVEGGLEVTKTVDSDLAADADVEFEFTVTLGDTTISGEYGDMTFEDGVATFTLKGGESATAEGLPTDVTYTVVETANDDFVTTKTGDTGTISTTVSTAAFTNTRVVGDLEVTKTVSSDLAADADAEFEFTVTLGDTTISGEYGDMTFEDGVATFTLKGGESATAEGLPTDVTYTVVEKAAEGFTTEKTGDTGTISTTASTAAFTNTRETGELEVTKTVESPQAYDSAVDFTFTVTLTDKTISGTYGEMTFEDGVATFTLKDGQTKKAKDLPTTVGYKVEETAYTGFTTEKTGDTGSISKTASTAAFTNTAATTKITANKVWKDDENKDGKRPEKVTFTLEGTVAGEEEPVYSTTKEAAVAQDAEGAATATWYDLTTHYNGEKITYKVTEAEIDLYTTKVGDFKEVKDAEGNVTGYTVDVTNTHTPFKTKVTVIKDWADDSDYDKQRPKSITVHLFANKEEIDEQTLTAENKVGDNKNQWTYTWDDLDLYKDGEKITYEVTEDEVEGYSTTITKSTVQTDKEDESTIEYKVNVTNTIDTVVPRAKYPILKINKKDQDGIALNGVKFHLENGEKKSADYETVDGIATIDFQDLGADGLGWLPVDEREGQSAYTFKLYETKVDGYDVAGPWDVEVKLNGDAKYEVVVKDGKSYWDRFIEWIIGNVKANENAQTEFDGKNIVFNVVNPASAQKLTITKAFDGIDTLPTDFAIDVTYTKYSKTAGVVAATKTLKVADAKTVDGKLTWTIEDVRYGTPVKVEELGYNIPLYEETTSVTVTPKELDSSTTATLEKTYAEITSMPDNDDTVVAFTNDYKQTPPEKHVFTGGVTTNIDGKPVKAGQHLTYEITYKNTATKAVTAVITDTIPASTDFVKVNDSVPATTAFVKEGNDLKWTAQLGPEEEMKVSFEVEVKGDTETVLTNKAKVVDDNNKDGVWTEEIPNSKPVKEVFNAKEPTITIDGKTVRAKDELLYKLSYTNVSGKTQSVGFKDKIPANTEFVEASEGGSYDEETGFITWKAVDVSPEEPDNTIEVTFKVKVKENNGVSVDNTGTAIVDNNDYDTNKTSNPVPEDPKKTVFASNSTTEIDGQMVEAGDKLVYSIVYKNTTADDADVDIFDTVPKYTTFTGNWTADPSEGVTFSKKTGEEGRDELTWKAKVEKGKSITVTFEVEVEKATSGTEITNKGHVRESGNVYDTNETSNSKPVKDVIESPESTTSIDGKTVKPNEVLTYSITYTNPDKKNAQTVQIADKIPTYTKYKEDSASTVNGVTGKLVNGSVTWADVKVAAGATITVTFQVTVDDTVSGEMIVNDATVRDSNNTYTTNGVSNPTPPKKEIYTGTSTTNIDGQRVEPGQELTYSIKYTNPTDDAVAATITDTIPAHTTLVEGSITGGGTLSGKQITWLKNVPKGDSVIVTFKVKVDEDVSGQILTNESTVKYGDNEYTSNEVSNPTPPKKEVFTGGSKTNIDGKDVEPGDELTYQITFVNDKVVDGKAVDVEANIRDEIPAHTTYVPDSADNDGVYADGAITWKKTVAAGDTWTVSFKVKVDGNAAGEELRNEAVYKEGENGKEIKTNEVVNPVTKELEIKKSLASYLDHGKFVKAAFSFRVTGTYEETAEDGTKKTKNFNTIVGMDFDSESDIEQTKLLTGLPSTLKDVQVEEIYSGNYDPDKTGPVSITEDGGTFKVEFSNKFTDDYEPKGGVTNKYVRGDNGYKYQGESTAGGQGN